MFKIVTNKRVNVRGVDPTRTATLRNTFVRASNRRFNRITQLINQAVNVEDVFGLRVVSRPVIFSITPGSKAFEFVTSQEKVTRFMSWLRIQVDAEILETTTMAQFGNAANEAWTNIYVKDTYKRGIIRAREELKKAGFLNIPTVEQSGGIDFVMGTPFHVDRLGLLYSRVFENLRGITAQMDTQISRILAQGLGDGDGPILLAKKMVGVINGTGAGNLGLTDTIGRFIPAKRRAIILARTEIIRVHHQATIIEYRNWGAAGIAVLAEISTAMDDRVCPICAPQQGAIYSLQDAMNLIPFHPQCRCMALPFRGTDTPTTWNDISAVKSGNLPQLGDIR